MLLEAWRDFELNHGDQESVTAVAKRLPKKIKKKRALKADDGVRHFFLFLFYLSLSFFSSNHSFIICFVLFQTELGWEEYYDYIFPDEEDKQGNLKILEKARLWKKQKLEQEQKLQAERAADMADM